DVTGEEVDVSQCCPVRAAALEGIIGAFQPCPNPSQIEKVLHHLPTGAAEVQAAQGGIAELTMQLAVHVEDEFLVRAVVGGGALGSDMVWRLEGDPMLCLHVERADGSGPAGAADGPGKKPDDFVNNPVNPHMNLVPNAPEL